MSKLTIVEDIPMKVGYIVGVDDDHYLLSFPLEDTVSHATARDMVMSYNFLEGTKYSEIERMGTFETYKVYRDAQYEGVASMFAEVVEDCRTQANLLFRIARWRRVIHWNDYDSYIFKDLVDLEHYLEEKGIAIADFPPKSE